MSVNCQLRSVRINSWDSPEMLPVLVRYAPLTYSSSETDRCRRYCAMTRLESAQTTKVCWAGLNNNGQMGARSGTEAAAAANTRRLVSRFIIHNETNPTARITIIAGCTQEIHGRDVSGGFLGTSTGGPGSGTTTARGSKNGTYAPLGIRMMKGSSLPSVVKYSSRRFRSCLISTRTMLSSPGL